MLKSSLIHLKYISKVLEISNTFQILFKYFINLIVMYFSQIFKTKFTLKFTVSVIFIERSESNNDDFVLTANY